MPSRTIMISDDAYQLLKKMKRDNESFTDLIIRLTSQRGNISRLLDLVNSSDFSPVSPETANKMTKASKEMRKKFKLRDIEL